MANDLPPQSELEPREPTVEDLRDLCRELNQRGAEYVVYRWIRDACRQPGRGTTSGLSPGKQLRSFHGVTVGGWTVKIEPSPV